MSDLTGIKTILDAGNVSSTRSKILKEGEKSFMYFKARARARSRANLTSFHRSSIHGDKKFGTLEYTVNHAVDDLPPTCCNFLDSLT